MNGFCRIMAQLIPTLFVDEFVEHFFMIDKVIDDGLNLDFLGSWIFPKNILLKRCDFSQKEMARTFCNFSTDFEFLSKTKSRWLSVQTIRETEENFGMQIKLISNLNLIIINNTKSEVEHGLMICDHNLTPMILLDENIGNNRIF